MHISWVFVGCFVGVRWVFRGCSLGVSWVFVALLTIRSQHYGRPQAAVGAIIVPAYMKTPTKWGEENTCVVKWIYVFDNVKMRIR